MSSKQLAQESPPPGELEFINDLTERLKAKITNDNPTGIMRRDAHPKMHGVVKAEVIIEPDLPEQLRIGIFRQPGIYQAWIRFSNQDGIIRPDNNRDIRGMAIKLMGIEGEKLLAEESTEKTQDFILISTTVFVTRDAEEFDELIKAFTGSIFAKLLFFATRWRVVWNLLKSMKKFANPLQVSYWSTTPYLFGNMAVKYAAMPTGRVTDTIPDNPDDDFLRLAMIKQLDQGEALFDFAVQLQTNADEMPIEDAGRDWSESVSPFRKVATIRVPKQHFDSEKQREFGENLSFTPWHCLPEHRPLGGINRARKVVYRAISLFRHEQNNVPRKEPVGWEI